jgi:hypothetical protein
LARAFGATGGTAAKTRQSNADLDVPPNFRYWG